ncbi:capsular polysaccharide biosynthesis protein [Pseudomonas sp. JQ170C]|uniref:capsular polysaccharide biosynthesis protein n=1 Tax=unclassified Pseudomonas TaxID=196821 RepID=UPI00265B5029|nr:MULTISPECIES: capsular polysaccharide biosynthesis protein [unclassified Pseudomonas]WRO74568.1 capsular polysaccharide biosynthesis protein [Pseudomonas sp. 170C]
MSGPTITLQPLVDGPGWVGVMSQWVAWKVLHLPQFLGPEGPPYWLWRRGQKAPKGLKAIAGIGYKDSSAPARVLCKRWGLPYIAIEDGFLRSSSLGVEGDTPMSLVVDPVGIHYLADRPSLLENILQAPDELTPAELDSARQLIALMRSSGIGKYNNAPDLDPADPLGRERPLVLVVDQTAGDYSIPGGGLTEADYVRMLDAALAENPDAEVRVRIHPDCVGGHKPSCLLAAATARGVALEARPVSWASLARRARRVYIGTSQAGLEALIQGVPVTCFGLPFYAGWGLTDDRMPIPRRQARPDLVQLVAAAYVRYCRYVDPLTGQLTDALTVARQLARKKAQDAEFAGDIIVLGIKRHKQHNIRRFFSSRWGRLSFAEDSPTLVADVAARQGKVLVWAAREPADLKARAAAADVPVWRVEDGFLRSNGLGVRNAPALSLVLDRRGMHFDTSAPCDLEHLLEHTDFDAETLMEAARLREGIVARRVSKYNLNNAADNQIHARPGQRRILVPGQVEDDASLRYCTDGLRDNLSLLAHVRASAPDAWIVYKPHPDVEAGKRRGFTPDHSQLALADQVLCGVDIASLYDQVDEVHTLSSTAGFEALLRGLTVATYGTPFYAGWGLTHDHLPFTRRTRRLTLDQLVAGALLRYARYADPQHALPCDAWHALTCLSNHRPQQLAHHPRLQPLLNYTRTMLGCGRTEVP